MRFSSARCAPTWSTATSPASAAARCPTPRRSAVGAWRWGRRRSSRFTNGWFEWRKRKGLRPAGGCVSTPRWSRPTSTIRPIQACSGDGVRVLIRAMKKITAIAGEVGARLRDRSRGVKLRVLDIARAARAKGPQSQARLRQGYGRLLASTSRVVGQAKRFAREIADGVKGAHGVAGQLALEGLRQQLEEMAPRVRQVMKQARARIFGGDTRAEGKLLSLFEPSTEIIRKGKAAKPNEFGKMVKLQEAENQIVIDYEVYDRRPNDSDLLIAAIETHQARLGRTPRLVAADAAFYSIKNETAAKEKGVKRVCIPNRNTKSSERKREQKKRWFRNGQKWRTGCEGRISVLKRRHGLRRCLNKGEAGMKRWVGLGVIADNLLHIGSVLAKRKN